MTPEEETDRSQQYPRRTHSPMQAKATSVPTTTGANGYYTLGGLPAGDYTVTAQRAGFTLSPAFAHGDRAAQRHRRQLHGDGRWRHRRHDPHPRRHLPDGLRQQQAPSRTAATATNCRCTRCTWTPTTSTSTR